MVWKASRTASAKRTSGRLALVGRDEAVAQRHDPRGVRRDVVLVGHHHDRLALAMRSGADTPAEINGSSTLWSELARGSRLKDWKTNPISLLRMRASSSSERSLTFRPLSQYSPAVGVSRQPTRFMSVDFPDPDGPIT